MSRHGSVYVCTKCDHLSSDHRLKRGGDLVDGPYLCPCGCSIPQNGPYRLITERQWRSGEAFTPLPPASPSETP